MSQFLTPLRLERIEDKSHDGRGTWRLLRRLVYESDVAGIRVIAPKGFITDLASVPRLPFAYLLVGGLGHAAAVIHDCLYSTHVTTRQMADDVFHEALLVLGVEPWQARLMYWGVRIGGWAAWDRPGQKQEEAPYAQLLEREAP